MRCARSSRGRTVSAPYCYREQRLEPPGRIGRVIGSARRLADERLSARTVARLREAVIDRLEELIAERSDEGGGAGGGGQSLYAELRADSPAASRSLSSQRLNNSPSCRSRWPIVPPRIARPPQPRPIPRRVRCRRPETTGTDNRSPITARGRRDAPQARRRAEGPRDRRCARPRRARSRGTVRAAPAALETTVGQLLVWLGRRGDGVS